MTSHYFLPDPSCDKWDCLYCGGRKLQRIQDSVNFFAFEFQMRYFYTLTDRRDSGRDFLGNGPSGSWRKISEFIRYLYRLDHRENLASNLVDSVYSNLEANSFHLPNRLKRRVTK